MDSVIAHGVEYRIHDTPYWHLTPRNSLICDNARIGQGICTCASVTAPSPGLAGVTSPYAFRSGSGEGGGIRQRAST